jgi:SAM-dependent methyltransferase
MSEPDVRTPYLPENLWGYGKRFRFVDDSIQREFPGRPRREIRVLDIGCGNGSQLAIPLANIGYQVTGVDPHCASIERGRILAPAVEFLHGVVGDFALSCFDCVILSEVLEHLDEPETLLATAATHLGKSGILIVTVPNGYGEFELDRRVYRTLRIDRLVGWLWSKLKRDGCSEILAGSEDESPHVQRFTISGIRKMFARNNLRLVEARGTSLASGPFVSHLLGRFNVYIRLNAEIADYLPLPLVAGWMFSLKITRS